MLDLRDPLALMTASPSATTLARKVAVMHFYVCEQSIEAG